MSVEKKLEKFSLKLPHAPAPRGVYMGAKQAGNIVFSAGKGSRRQGLDP